MTQALADWIAFAGKRPEEGGGPKQNGTGQIEDQRDAGHSLDHSYPFLGRGSLWPVSPWTSCAS